MTDSDSHNLLSFCGYSLAYCFDLYARHHVKPDTPLCWAISQQQGRTTYAGFESDSASDSFWGAHDYLLDLDETEGFDVAAVVVELEIGEERDEILFLRLFQPPDSMDRYIYYPRQRVESVVVPNGKPLLKGAWSDEALSVGEQGVLTGMQQFYLEHESVM